MYVRASGLMGYRKARVMRRGMGALNCPGDPGCPGYVAPGSQEEQTALLQAILANQVDAGGYVPESIAPTGQSQSFTQLLNDNAGKLAIGGAAFLGLMLFAKAGR